MNPFEDPNFKKLQGEYPALQHIAAKMSERAKSDDDSQEKQKMTAPKNKRAAHWKPGLEHRLGKNDD